MMTGLSLLSQKAREEQCHMRDQRPPIESGQFFFEHVTYLRAKLLTGSMAVLGGAGSNETMLKSSTVPGRSV